MISKIEKKIIMTNLVIVIFSLVLLCLVITVSMSLRFYKDIRSQLISENRIAYRFSLLDRNQKMPKLYNDLSESTNILYEITNGRERVRFLSKQEDIDTDKLLNEIQSLMSDDIEGVYEIEIDNQKYLVTQSNNRFEKNKDSVVLISMISLESIKMLWRQNLSLLIKILLIVIIVTLPIIYWLSRKISKPIVMLKNTTDRYARRQFDEKIEIESDDEVGELAISVEMMAKSLIEYEKQQSNLYRNISHDIKTPLTAIYGYAEGIKKGIFDDDEEKLDIIMDESLRIKHLVENIILLSKLENNMEIFDFQHVDLIQVMISAIEKIESIAIINNIDIIFEPDHDIVMYVDREKILRSFLNVIGNAIKYTKDEVLINIKETVTRITFEIIDNGHGFDENTIENLFSQKAKEKQDGSGIGLSIVKEIMEKHNGKVKISNDLRGAKVELIFLK